MRVSTARHWAQLDAQRERIAKHRTEAQARHGKACGQVAAIAAANTERELPLGATEAEISAAADRRAALMGERIAGLSALLDAVELLGWLNAQVQAMQARPFVVREGHEGQRIAGLLARAQAPEWWRRQLRREVLRRTEAAAIGAGRVNAKAGQWYASDDTVRRRLLQNKRNRAMLERTEVENEDGDVYTLAALADKGTGNKAIRRGELMTRIRGCEEWAEAAGHAGLFLTLTCPSRFHSTHYAGGLNPKYEGATPRDAQDWLCATWARARAQLARLQVPMYGFRVAEPHHDGCPHWHALLWVETARDALMLRSVLWAQWLADDGDEAGAADHRVKCVSMEGGHAAGYVAKYIAKNIDDAGAVGREGHSDMDRWGADLEGQPAIPGGVSDRGGGDHGEPLLQGELWANPAQRVEAWAAAWGIRQFQAIGQPPVTVWRELRRVQAEAVELTHEGGQVRGPMRLALALDAVNRRDEDRADWCSYVQAQGGVNVGRDYALRIARQVEPVQGRYELIERAKPLGVYEHGAPETMVASHRKEWKPRSGAKVQGGSVAGGMRATAVTGMAAGSRRAPPWTRVNNCTQGRAGRWLAGLGISLASPLDGVRGGLKAWAGGLATEETPPWQTSKPPSAPSWPRSAVPPSARRAPF